MENITLGQVHDILVFLVSLSVSVATIMAFMKKMLDKMLKPMERSLIKTDLVNFINDVENGMIKSEIQKVDAHEQFDRYSELGGNSYVHEHWEKLKKEGKI